MITFYCKSNPKNMVKKISHVDYEINYLKWESELN